MRVLALSLLALHASGAVIQGVVLDEESGNPLARSVVNLIPLPGTQAGPASVRAGERGAFAINNVNSGWYVLRSTRRGFVPAEVGQLRPGRPGMPFEITADSKSSFFQIRMKRLGALAGSVLDENSVGIPDWPVHIYSARKPVRHVGETKTDDRGNFRIGELDAGSYIVRSGAGVLEDESYLLPTFYKFGTAVENAEAVHVRVGETQTDVVLRPVKGRMIELSGFLTSPVSAVLTLITDTGRRVVASGGPNPVPFKESVAPGVIELLAEGNGSRCGGYARLTADHDMQGIRIACTPLEPSFVSWFVEGGRRTQFNLTMRRVDLDGTGPVRTLNTREPIVPGHWELHALTSSDYYVKSISTLTSQQRSETRNDGWFGLDLGTSAQIVVTLSSKPASVSGVVTAAGSPVVGAAVYLELYDAEQPNPRLEMFEGRSDAQGSYKFAGLAPGRYRVLSSFDFDPEDRFAMEKAAALTLRDGDNAVQPLELIVP